MKATISLAGLQKERKNRCPSGFEALSAGQQPLRSSVVQSQRLVEAAWCTQRGVLSGRVLRYDANHEKRAFNSLCFVNEKIP